MGGGDTRWVCRRLLLGPWVGVCCWGLLLGTAVGQLSLSALLSLTPPRVRNRLRLE